MGAAGTSGADNRLLVDMGGVQSMSHERRARGKRARGRAGILQPGSRLKAGVPPAAGRGAPPCAYRRRHAAERHIEAAAAVQCAGMIGPNGRPQHCWARVRMPDTEFCGMSMDSRPRRRPSEMRGPNACPTRPVRPQ